jgi:hypothetical protein
MPRLKQLLAVFVDKAYQASQFVFGETTIFRQLDRFQPKLGHLSIALHVNVRRLSSI